MFNVYLSVNVYLALSVGLPLLKITFSSLKNKLRGRIGYVYVPELEAQIISSLKVSVIVHDEVNRDQFRDVGNVEPPRAACLDSQFSVKICHNSWIRTTPIWNCPRMAIPCPYRKMFSQSP